MIDSVVWAQYINVTDRQPRHWSVSRSNAEINCLRTYPSALVSNPLCYPLRDHELDDPADDVREKAGHAPTQVGYREAVAKTEQRYDTTPVNAALTKQPGNTHDGRKKQQNSAIWHINLASASVTPKVCNGMAP